MAFPEFPLDVPAGKVRFGVSFDDKNLVDNKWETPIGKPLPMYRRFFSWANALTGNMAAEAQANYDLGRATWLSFKTPETTTSWADVAAGDYQAEVDAFLIELRDTGIALWLTPYHEPEDNEASEAPGNGKSLSGTLAEWRDMVRYIEARRAVVGADNVLIVPIYMSWTFDSLSGRDIDEWLLLDTEFPVIGVDPYSSAHATGPARITQATFNTMIAKLELVNKRIAIAECGGQLNNSDPRPPELWEAFAQECLDHDILACCWFDVGINDITGTGTSADPTGTLFDAILASFDSTTAYREGLLWEPTPPPDPTWVLGAPKEAGFPDISGELATPVIQYTTTNDIIEADSSISYTLLRPPGSNSDTDLIGIVEIDIPNNETWDVTVSFNVTPININRNFTSILVSGNPGFAAAPVAFSEFDTDPGADLTQTLSLAGRCVGRSFLILAGDIRAGIFVDNFDSEGVFVSSNPVPTDVLGIWDASFYSRWGLPRYTDPTSGSYVAQYNGTTINIDQDSEVRFLRSREASKYVDTSLPDPYYWELPTPDVNGPGVVGAITLDIPEGELWNVNISFSVDRKYGDRSFAASLVNGDPTVLPVPDIVDFVYLDFEFVAPPLPYGEMIVIGDSISALNAPTWVDALDESDVVTSVINSSISGSTSTSMRALIEANDPGPAQPQSTDVFVVFFGANDINTTVPSIGVPLITAAEYQENLEWFLDNYPADRQIVMYPWEWSYSFVAGVPVDTNVYLEYRDAALAAAMSRNADFIDVGVAAPNLGYSPGNPSPYQEDGIHPNATGDTFLAGLVSAKLNEYISGPKRSDIVELSGLCTKDTMFGVQGDYRGGVLAWNFDSSGYYVSDIAPVLPEQPAITWLEPGSRVYERGVDRGVLYFDNGAVVPWQGLTSVDEQIDIGSESVYFDGVKIAEIPVGGGFSAKVSAITYPDQLEEAYGIAPVRDGFSVGDQPQQRFSFSYRNKIGNELTEDLGYKIHLMYNVTALPDDTSYATISDDIDLVEFGWDFLTIPEHLDGYRPSAHIVFDTSEVSPEIITALELILYGSPTVPPALPSLNDLLATIAGFDNFITVTDNGDGTWTADTDASGVINDLGGGLVEIQHATIQMTSDNSYLISSTPDAP